MASFDYDVVIIGSGFGGSVAALRAAEKGYRVGVMESGRRWKDEDIPKTQWDLPHFSGCPPRSSTGSRGSSTSTTCSSSPAPASAAARTSMRTRCTSHRSSSSTRRSGPASPTGPTSWRRTSTRRRGCSASSATRTCPPTSTGPCSRSRSRSGEGRPSTRPRSASTSAAPGVEADDPYFGGVGPRRTGCISCGNCNIGCGHNAKNKLTTNYLYLAEKLGAEVHELHEVLRPRPARWRRLRGARASSRLGAARGASSTITPTPPSR